MTNEQIIKQLSELIDDCEAFCINEPEHGEIYIKDIAALKAAIEFLKNAALVKHGKWFYNMEGYARCSYCNEHEQNEVAFFFTYCPNCCARMDGDMKRV